MTNSQHLGLLSLILLAIILAGCTPSDCAWMYSKPGCVVGDGV